MKRLLIMRHAKSSRDEPAVRDHDRPLNDRGELDAPHMGERLAKMGIRPDYIVSSTAVRALSTARLFAEANGFSGIIHTDSRLYMAAVSDYLEVLSEAPPEVDTLLVVSHNPGSEEFLHHLSGAENAMPTAAVAVVELEPDHAKPLGKRHGRLKLLLTPKQQDEYP